MDFKDAYQKELDRFSAGPLVINNMDSKTLWLYDITTPFMIILETCHERDGLYSVFQFSPETYSSMQFGEQSPAFSKTRPLHQHSCVEIMYVLSGSVTNHVENQIFTYGAGQCCIMNKNIRHCEEFTGDFQAVFFMLREDYTIELLNEYMHFKPSLPADSRDNIFRLLQDSQNGTLQFDKDYLDCFPVIPAADISEKLSPLLNFLIYELIDPQPGSSFFWKGAFSRLLQLMDDPALFSINRIHSDSSSQEYLFDKMTHIMQSSHGRCTREDLSAQLHYNGEYLNRIMKKYSGKTILEYGQSVYLEEAKRLLTDTDKSISAIIEELGFSNRSHFYRLFQKTYGETPSNYRKHTT